MNRDLNKIKIIELTEYKTELFTKDEIPESIGIELYQKYRKQIDIEFPNYKTENQWQLKAKGWVGYIPLNYQLAVKINPKVSIDNIFVMLKYAYKLKSFTFIEGLMNCDSLQGFYNNLAYTVAQLILNRVRKGLYRIYIPETQHLAYVRGRLDISETIKQPWNVKLKSHYQEQTIDIEDNQILLWTLFIISRNSLCSEEVSKIIRKAYHTLQSLVTIKYFSYEDCFKFNYNRLNQDYKLLHYLCRFFLENTSPIYNSGNRKTLPFLVNMAKLYELFVAEWLKINLPSNLILQSQKRVNIAKNLNFQIDLVLYDISTNKNRYILDTKYKNPDSPSSDDVAQVVAYAVSQKCSEVILIYPTTLTHPLDKFVGNIRVRSLTFSLDKNIDEAGNTFLKQLLS
ncbi:MAG: restriction endonuclease [Cyanobacteria bacterium P01_A01_bin.68]